MKAWLLRVSFGCVLFTIAAYVILFGFMVVASFVRLDFEAFRYIASEMSWLGFRWVVVASTFLSITIFSED